MRIAILQTGKTNPAMPPEFQDYPSLFSDMFATDPRSARHELVPVAVVDGEMPTAVDEYDAYLVTGSRHGVYDDLAWIPQLMDFIRQAHAANIPLIGVCFGHQIIAHALGGHAAKSKKGWGLGVREVALFDAPEWMRQQEAIRLIHIHQDQVEKLPDGAKLIGSNAFCPNAMFMIDNNVFCAQGHPEFTIEYIEALMETRLDILGPDAVADAKSTLANGHEGATFASWILAFLDHHERHKAAA